jgi:hypothetical protein
MTSDDIALQRSDDVLARHHLVGTASTPPAPAPRILEGAVAIRVDEARSTAVREQAGRQTDSRGSDPPVGGWV